ncbi:hypothetical protein ILUMI_13867 [Ignelater luminosus]|uniref:Uncharacterized protein n=1 Tax=Ignelater luminosus TaxID=2038154 RepID=A0A8K0CTL2_IGNLU|nr:hypothetical protein ILUMI_13867 [Ignelater luminosus]
MAENISSTDDSPRQVKEEYYQQLNDDTIPKHKEIMMAGDVTERIGAKQNDEVVGEYVRSKLEFASAVWNPDQIIHQDKIETVQNKFPKYLYYKAHGKYPGYNEYQDIRSEFKIDKLYNRRELGDICFIHKLINNRIDCPKLLPLGQLYVPAHGSRPRNILYIPKYRTNLRFCSPLIRLATVVNKISYETDIDIFDSSPYRLKNYYSNYFRSI